MINTLRKLFLPLIVLLSLGFLLMLISQVSQVYLLASNLNPIFGKIVLFVLVGVCLLLMVSPMYVYFRLPKPLRRPNSEAGVEKFKMRLDQRIKGNPLIIKSALTQEAVLEDKLIVLDKEADKVIYETAKIVFLTTSISQNGKLDAFTVLGTQLRMVWKIAHIYYQRPSLRELAYLYTNVGANAFLSNEIEDIDISRQIEPIASAMLRNSTGRTVPVIGPAASLILDSVVEGSTNAFLTLRVGIMARKYCGYPGLIDKQTLRKQVLKESAQKLKDITVSSSGKIISSMLKATKDAGLDTLRNSWRGVRTAGQKVKDGFTGTRVNPFGRKKKDPTATD